MKLFDLLNHRRATRTFDAQQPIDTAIVRQCIEQSMLAPTSSNMQLWEAYHITDKKLIAQLAEACLSQTAAQTAQEVVVFVTRADRAREHARLNLRMNIEQIRQEFPTEKHEKYIRLQQQYYGKLIPFIYSRAWGLIGAFRKSVASCVSWFRPMMTQVSEGNIRVSIHKSCALVAQSFMLGMAEAGYDTCPLEGFDHRRVKQVLGLSGCGVEINMVIPCGIRSVGGVQGQRLRLPFDTFYHQL